MGISEKVKEKYINRLDQLIKAGEVIPILQKSKVSGGSFVTGEKTYRHYSEASWPEFVEWRTSCIAVIEQVVPPKSVLRNTVDQFDALGNEPSKLQFAISFLKSIKTELVGGFFDDLILQIESEVTADYLGQAENILTGEKGVLSHIPAAVLAGAALEKSLKTICANLTPPEAIANDKGAPLGMNALIDALKKRQVFNELKAKQLRAWADIRNSAAHGNFDEFDRHQVELMLTGVGTFLAQHLH